jgi:hypothetical protein
MGTSICNKESLQRKKLEKEKEKKKRKKTRFLVQYTMLSVSYYNDQSIKYRKKLEDVLCLL